MRRWVVLPALLLVMGVALPAFGEDACDSVDPNGAVAAVATCRRLADQGDVRGEFNLGFMYLNGFGVPQDYAEAARWYRKAADQGNSKAQDLLGSLYDRGEGVPRDYAQAASWYRKAADQGYAPAQFSLGWAYENREGVPRDYVAAYMWFSLAAANKSEFIVSIGAAKMHYDQSIRNDAARMRDEVAARMIPSQIEQAKALAAVWKPTTGQ